MALAGFVQSALEKQPLFRGLDEAFFQDVESRAQKQYLPEKAECSLFDRGPLVLVQSGLLQLRIGTGPATDAGPGSVLNVAGMLGLGSTAQPFRPGAKALQEDRRVVSKAAGSDAQQELEAHAKSSDLLSCIHNLCPHAPSQLTAETCAEKLTGWLRVTAIAAGAVSLTTISKEDLEQALADSRAGPAEATVRAQYVANRDALISKWRTLLRCFVLPGAPLDVVWAMAELSEWYQVGPGEVFIEEGDTGEASQDLFVIENGEAVVEKLDFVQGVVTTVVVGSLQSGAIIGDIRFMGANIPRAATVRARTPMMLLHIKMTGVFQVLRRFPGLVGGMKVRAKQMMRIVQASLPPRKEVLPMMRIFSSTTAGFRSELAKISERKVFYCGDVIKEQGGTDATLTIMEFGVCSVEKDGLGLVDTAPAGTCFGERTFLGTSTHANATIRVVTPLAICITVTQQGFRNVLTRFPEDRQEIESWQGTISGLRGCNLTQLDILKRSGPSFVEAIGATMKLKCYLPGQTVCVQGQVDECSMFVIKGGRCACIIHSKFVREMTFGTPFGEFSMLGLTRQRTATVRAISISFLFEFPRSCFLEALDAHPEERANFADITTKYAGMHASVQWPIFAGASADFVYLVNLYCERKIVPDGEALPADVAILVLQGKVAIIEDGKRKEVTHGQCIREHILIGADLPHVAEGSDVEPVVAAGACEVQTITKAIFEKIMAEFTEFAPIVQQGIVNEMAGKAEKKLAAKTAVGSILCFSAIFRISSDEFMNLVRPKLEARMYRAGEEIMREETPGDSLFILIAGKAHTSSTHVDLVGSAEVAPGRVFGEANILGLSDRYSTSLCATTTCVFQTLSRRDFQGAVEVAALSVRDLFNRVKESEGRATLQEKLHRNHILLQAGEEFVSIACTQAQDVFYAPGEEILLYNDPCELGRSPMYVLLSGEAIAETDFQIVLGSLHQGDLFGENGALGLTNQRNATVRAGKHGLTHCARLSGRCLKAAMSAYPDQHQALSSVFMRRSEANASFIERRRKWLKNIVVPALVRANVFGRLPLSAVRKIAKPLVARKYKRGEIVTNAGDFADSMILLLKGVLEIQSKFGVTVGLLRKGAVVGEVAVMGLFSIRTATLRAVRDCIVIDVPRDVVREVLADPGATAAQEIFDRQVMERQQQVDEGLPLSVLLGLQKQDVCARAIALQAERVEFSRERSWWPLADTSPCGPHFGILIRGRANIIMGKEAMEVMVLLPGSIFSEGLLAEYGAYLRASGSCQCEAYQLRLHDLSLVAHSVPAAKRSFHDFQKLWDAARENIRMRLSGTRTIMRVRQLSQSTSQLDDISLKPDAGGIEQGMASDSDHSIDKLDTSFQHNQETSHLPELPALTKGLAASRAVGISKSCGNLVGGDSPKFRHIYTSL